MGGFLDAPIKDKNPDPGVNENFMWGACGMQGWRSGMEDTHICQSVMTKDNYKSMLFGVFDGHGGKEVAEYAREHFKKIFMQQQKFKEQKYDQALKDTFLAIDDKLKDEDFAVDAGATACVVFVTKDKIITANAGDSRAVLSRSKRAVALSEDHKPNDPIELARIQKAGHQVFMERVDGTLALSRALGDFNYKNGAQLTPQEYAVTCNPDLDVKARTKEDDFIIVACDGIWDCVSNQECVERIQKSINSKNLQPTNICPPVEDLLENICATTTADGAGTDNMTCILVQFK